MHRHPLAFVIDHIGAHAVGIFGAKVENLPNLDTTAGFAPPFRDCIKQRRVVGFVGAGIGCGPVFGDTCALCDIVKIHLAVPKIHIQNGGVIEHLGFAGIGQHQKLMGILATNRAGIRAHRDRL